MAIEHKDIPDVDLHEPKGAASATANTLLAATGTGATAFRRWQHTDHAQMVITNNSTPIAIPAAADPTLNTDSDYVKIATNWSSTHGLGITFNIDELQVAVDGHYLIHFWADLLVPLNNNFIGIKYAVNDTAPYSLQKLKTQSVTTNDYKNISGSGYLTLSANDTLSVYIAASKADNIVVEEAGFVAYLAHGV